MSASYSGKAHKGDINELQNLYSKIKFTMQHSSKELLFLDILIKNINGQIITDMYNKPTGTQQYLHFKTHHPKICIKSIPYTLTHRIHTIIIDKTLKKTCLKELRITLNQRGYPTTLINKGFELEKNNMKRIKEPKSHHNEKHQAYIATYNKNNPELFTEIIKKI